MERTPEVSQHPGRPNHTPDSRGISGMAKPDYTDCLTCGNTIKQGGRGRIKKYCSEPCRSGSPQHERTQACHTCGTPIQAKSKNHKYCSKPCQYRAEWKHKKSNKAECAHCGGTIVHAGPGRPQKYCDGECKREAEKRIRLDNYKPAPKVLKRCQCCGKAFKGTKHSKYCSTKCSVAYHVIKYRDVDRDPRECGECGVVFFPKYGQAQRRFCSEECSVRYNRRIGKGTRRARMAGCDREWFDPLEILSRDGWKCQYCGADTPKSKRGTCDPDAPELDHVVPLSKGGAHTRSNTQCLCRRCNQDKSDSIAA